MRHDRQAPYPVHAHAFDRLGRVFGLVRNDHGRTHQASNRRFRRIEPLGEHLHHDVAIGHHPEGYALVLRVIHHHQIADVPATHEIGRLQDTGLSAAADYAGGTYIFQ